MRVYLADLTLPDISTVQGILSEENTSFDVPAPAPDGEWILVGMRHPRYGPGLQLWLMPPDARSAQTLTTDEAYSNHAYRWDPSGMAVLFQRLELQKPYAVPETWVWYRAENRIERLVEKTAAAEWLP